MPYKNSDLFKIPSDDTIIWRYMSYDKFKDLIEKEALFFYSVINYRKGDPLEGAMTDYTHRTIGDTYFLIDGVQATPEQRKKAVEFVEKFLVVNCWGIDNREVRKKWDIYAHDPHGIAIKTTVGQLKKSFSKTKDDVYIGRIRYIDHWIDSRQYSDPFSYTMLKDKVKFEWEHELRLLVVDDDYKDTSDHNFGTYNKFIASDIDKVGHTEFKYINCILEHLIGEIYISPWGNECFLNKVNDFLEQHHLSKPVHRSFYTGHM